MLAPHLREVLALQRETARHKGEALGLAPYDALLDQYDPGLRQARIDPIFATLRDALPTLIDEARTRQEREGAPIPLVGPFPAAAQRALGETLMRALGFDFTRGRLDTSLHPFCGGATGDVRITTRYCESNFTRATMGVLHETGHALYEQGRPREWLRQPVGDARGMTIHESQSLLIEMQACRTRAFLDYLAPLVRAIFGRDDAALSAGNLHRIYTRVEPGFIRVDADEVTYPAHILLRYDLERALIGGELEVANLPAAFNAGMRDSLGLTVTDDALGCLQDIHWPSGAWGYFPTYTPRNCSPPPAPRGLTSTRAWRTARSRRSSAGCVTRCTDREACSAPTSWSWRRPADRSRSTPILPTCASVTAIDAMRLERHPRSPSGALGAGHPEPDLLAVGDEIDALSLERLLEQRDRHAWNSLTGLEAGYRADRDARGVGQVARGDRQAGAGHAALLWRHYQLGCGLQWNGGFHIGHQHLNSACAPKVRKACLRRGSRDSAKKWRSQRENGAPALSTVPPSRQSRIAKAPRRP